MELEILALQFIDERRIAAGIGERFSGELRFDLVEAPGPMSGLVLEPPQCNQDTHFAPTRKDTEP